MQSIVPTQGSCVGTRASQNCALVLLVFRIQQLLWKLSLSLWVARLSHSISMVCIPSWQFGAQVHCPCNTSIATDLRAPLSTTDLRARHCFAFQPRLYHTCQRILHHLYIIYLLFHTTFKLHSFDFHLYFAFVFRWHICHGNITIICLDCFASAWRYSHQSNAFFTELVFIKSIIRQILCTSIQK